MKSGSAKDVFSDVYSDEWQTDFRKKEELLNSHFEKITSADYYQHIFKDVNAPCKLFIQEIDKNRNAKNLCEVEQYLAKFTGVCIYLQDFFKNLTAKHRYIGNYYGFVVDLDNARSDRLPELIDKITKLSHKPNIMVSSGNGIHLYYLFSEPFDFYSYTVAISMFEYRKRDEVFDVVKQVYDKLCDLYEDDNMDYKVDRGHLSRPIRMCGSTTKNDNIRTAGFHVTDERKSLEEYAEIFDVELIDDELAKYIDNLLGNNDDSETPEEVINESESDVVITTDMSPKFRIFDDINTTFLEYYKDNKADVRARWLEYAKKLGDDIRPAATSVWQKRQSVKEADYSNYMKTLFKIMHGATIGYRQKLLLIFCSRAAMYRVPEERMKEDARSIMIYWNEKWPHDIVREKELECAFFKCRVPTIFPLSHLMRFLFYSYIASNSLYPRFQSCYKVQQ